MHHLSASRAPSLLLALSLFGLIALNTPLSYAADKEVECADGVDNDGDTVLDCADNDCKEAPNCQKDGNPENSDARCSDWVDNDGDGVTDCDDQDCQVETIKACEGSWDAQLSSFNAPAASSAPSASLAGGDPRDLIGFGDDIDGERNDYLCADGIDNDGDGKIDCEDLGCQLDGSVQVCRGAPNMRFSIVGQVAQSYDFRADEDLTKMDTRVSRLQLRSFGPIPGIENSFYLISMLAERTPRLTFAMFSVPLGKSRHTLNVNSGAAGLSQSQALSIHKQLILQRTTVFRAFEQFNSAAIELSGPLNLDNTLQYRVFAAGGSGRFDGNVGGRSITQSNLNYPWSAGGQLVINVKGFYSRFDTPFLYTPVPLTIGLIVGAKYDRREQEHFASSNVQGAIRYGHFVLLAEHYFKKEFAYVSTQNAYHAQLGFLAIPKHLMLAVDYGAYLPNDFEKLPASGYSSTLRKPNSETQMRGAAHWYFYRDIGVLSLVYQKRFVDEGKRDSSVADGYVGLTEETLQLIAQYRF